MPGWRRKRKVRGEGAGGVVVLVLTPVLVLGWEPEMIEAEEVDARDVRAAAAAGPRGLGVVSFESARWIAISIEQGW